MGKRGPLPRGEYGRKIGRTAVLSTRLQPDTRALLVAAKEASGRSLSQELEHRLRQTSSMTRTQSSSMEPVKPRPW